MRNPTSSLRCVRRRRRVSGVLNFRSFDKDFKTGSIWRYVMMIKRREGGQLKPRTRSQPYCGKIPTFPTLKHFTQKLFTYLEVLFTVIQLKTALLPLPLCCQKRLKDVWIKKELSKKSTKSSSNSFIHIHKLLLSSFTISLLDGFRKLAVPTTVEKLEPFSTLFTGAKWYENLEVYT